MGKVMSMEWAEEATKDNPRCPKCGGKLLFISANEFHRRSVWCKDCHDMHAVRLGEGKTITEMWEQAQTGREVTDGSNQ